MKAMAVIGHLISSAVPVPVYDDPFAVLVLVLLEITSVDEDALAAFADPVAAADVAALNADDTVAPASLAGTGETTIV